MSINSQLARVPAAVWPLGIGFFVTTPLVWGNVGLSLVGPMPIIRGSLGPSQLSKKNKIRVWALFFKRAGSYVVPGSILTAFLHTVAAFTTKSPFVRNLSILSAMSSISILPWTLMAIMPTNDALLSLDEKDILTAQDEDQVTELLNEWHWRHNVRYVGFGIGWASGLAALWTAVEHSS